MNLKIVGPAEIKTALYVYNNYYDIQCYLHEYEFCFNSSMV